MPPVWIHAGLPAVAIAITYPLWHGFHPANLVAAGIVIIGIMLSILAHELSHALTARRFGLTPVLIRLHAGGGEAIWEGDSWTRSQDRLITIAGPFVNLVLGLVCFAAYAFFLHDPALAVTRDMPWSRPPPMGEPAIARALYWLGWLNLIWAGVNLLPAFPLDGGRLFYSAVETRWGPRKALFWTALLGTILAVVAKLVFVGGIMLGMVIWSPPYIAENWEALKSARRRSAPVIKLRKP